MAGTSEVPVARSAHADDGQPLIHGDGTPDATWLQSDVLRNAPVWTLDDCVPTSARLVVVAPHPDDEVLACGGLIAAHAARGGQVLVLAVTNGDASHAGCREWTGDALAAVRRAESAAGLALLATPGGTSGGTSGDRQGGTHVGIAPVRVDLGLPDGAVVQHGAALVTAVQQHLGASDVVVTTWLHDGHPDHDATAAATLAACHAVGCRVLQAPVWLWHWAHPVQRASAGGHAVPWHQLRALVLPDAAWQRKQLALAAHASQLQPRSDGSGPVLGTHIVQRAARRCEHFFVAG